MKELVALTDQKNKRVVVFDVDNAGDAVWEWTTDDERFICVSGVKLRQCNEYGTVMLVCASEGYIAVVKYPEKNIIWETVAEGNLHSVELLPDMRVAVAASDGNFIRIYDMSGESKYVEKYLEQAHGVLWDPENNVLWALGIDRLCAFDVRENITEIDCMTKLFYSGMTWGHDLAPVYGNTDLLWITTNEGVFQYSKKTKEFCSEYECCSVINGKHVKGVGNIPFTNKVFTIHPNNTFLPWCSNEFEMTDVKNKTRKTFKSESDAYYKVRIFCERYQ